MYTLDSDEAAKIATIRQSLTDAKSLLDQAAAALLSVQQNSDALMAIQKTKGRADSYNAAFGSKGNAMRLNGAAIELKGQVLRAHYEMSRDLQGLFTDGPTVVLAAPGR